MRYQECPWYVRLWRRRYYLAIPYTAMRVWLFQKEDPNDPNDFYFDFLSCWSLGMGIAQGKMDWTYSMEEVMEKLKKYKE